MDINFSNYETITVSLTTVPQLRTFPAAAILDGLHAVVVGQNAADDSQGGLFTWVPASVAVDDGVYVIKSDHFDTGRWIKTARGTTGAQGLKGDTGDVTPAATAAKIAAEAARDAAGVARDAASVSASAAVTTLANVNAAAAASLSAIQGVAADVQMDAATVAASIATANASITAANTATGNANASIGAANAAVDSANALLATVPASVASATNAANAAQTARLGAEAAQAAAIAARVNTAADVTTTNSNVTATNSALGQAVAAANSIGATAFFKSKSAATTAFAAATNLSTCSVFPDETMGGRATRYRKNTTDNASAWIFVRYVDAPPTYYCDSKYGSDANDGLTADTPKKSLAAIQTITTGLTGITVLLARGSHWKGDSFDLQNTRFGRINSYGQGKRPVIDGASNLFTGTWTQHATYTNVWYQDITLPFSTQGSGPGDVNRWHVGLWDEAPTVGPGTDTQSRILESFVKRVLNGDQSPDPTTFDANRAQTNTIAQTSQAGLLAIVNAHRNTFTVFPTATNVYEPNDGTPRTSFTVYFHPSDNSNPNANSRTVVINQQRGLAGMGKAMDCHNVIFARSGGKDMISGYQFLPTPLHNPSDSGDIFSGEFRNCSFWEAGAHGPVVNGMSFYDCDYVGHYMRDSYKGGAGAYHNFRSVGGINKGRGYEVVRCKVKRFGYAVYGHGNGDGTDVQNEVCHIDTMWAEDGAAVAVGGTVSQGYWVRNLKARDVDSCGASGWPATIYENCEIYMRPDVSNSIGNGLSTLATAYVYPSAGGAKFINSLVVSLGTNLTLPKTLATMSQTSQYPFLVLEKSTIIGNILAESNDIYRKLNVSVDRNSYLGIFNSNATGDINNELYPTGIITAQGPDSTGKFGAVLECLRTTPATIRAANAGIEAGVATGMRTQVWRKTIQQSDLVYASVGGAFTATGFTDNGDGTANVTTSFNYGINNLTRGLKIAGGNAGAADYVGTVIQWIDNGTLKVSPVPTGSMAGGKAVTSSFYRPYPFRDPVSAYISADGTQLNVANVTGMVVGQHIRVSNVIAGQPSFGVRTITAMSGPIITLDKACPWLQRSNKVAYRTISTPTGGTGRSLPTVSISWGFPIQMRVLIDSSFTLPKIAVTPAEGGADIVMSQQLAVLNGGFTQGGLVNVGFDSTGAAASYTNMDYESGYWSQGFGVAAGDILTLTCEIDVAEDRLTFTTSPDLGGYSPTPTCLLAQRRIGYRPSI